MDRNAFIKAMMEERKPLSIDVSEMIVDASLKSCDWTTKSMVIMEELAELQQCVSKSARDDGVGDYYGLLEEMADVYICLMFLRQHFEITDDEIMKAVNIKLLREGKRRGMNCEF